MHEVQECDISGKLEIKKSFNLCGHLRFPLKAVLPFFSSKSNNGAIFWQR